MQGLKKSEREREQRTRLQDAVKLLSNQIVFDSKNSRWQPVDDSDSNLKTMNRPGSAYKQAAPFCSLKPFDR